MSHFINFFDEAVARRSAITHALVRTPGKIRLWRLPWGEILTSDVST
jgi:hypothetical protein